MARSLNKPVFDTKRRIKLGIWGLGRGMSFFKTCSALNIDVVAGCDFNQQLRDRFVQANPGAYVTDDADKFLAQDFDAVLLATYCPGHGPDAIKCLQAGKHVLSEVTAFHTMAEGVALVDAVEKSGKVYQLAENYPYGRANMWLHRKWKEGLFGDLAYAEYEYVHECRVLAYTYGDGSPVIPGNQAHSWRSWLNFHYYNAHSLGPIMFITGLRPTRVTALPSDVTLAGFPMERKDWAMGGPTPSLINMSNGSVVRNLMGATTNDTHFQRIWGTLGAAEGDDWHFSVRLGASGRSPKMRVTPTWDGLGELAANAGHGGGDFFVLYYFARQILEGTPGPFDIYAAADCTMQGILSYKSGTLGGQPQDVPDFRIAKNREKYRNDHFAQPRLDYKNGLFPKNADINLTQTFASCMKDLINLTPVYRAYRDWSSITPDMQDPEQAIALSQKLAGTLETLQITQKHAQKIVDAYPDSTGARVLREMLVLGDAPIVSKPDYAKRLKAETAKLKTTVRKILTANPRHITSEKDPHTTPYFVKPKVSKLFAKTSAGIVGAVPKKLADKAGWVTSVHEPHKNGFVDIHSLVGNRDGIIYIGYTIHAEKPMEAELILGYDGPVQAWVAGKLVHVDKKRINPARPDRAIVPIKLKKGESELMIALDTDSGGGWGVYVRFATPAKDRKKGAPALLPTQR